MKQLTQAIFDGAPEWVKSAAIDENGELHYHSKTKDRLVAIPANGDWLGCHDAYVSPPDYNKTELVGSGYDATDWENSAIDREVSA